jgi:hypothetical protein
MPAQPTQVAGDGADPVQVDVTPHQDVGDLTDDTTRHRLSPRQTTARGLVTSPSEHQAEHATASRHRPTPGAHASRNWSASPPHGTRWQVLATRETTTLYRITVDNTDLEINDLHDLTALRQAIQARAHTLLAEQHVDLIKVETPPAEIVSWEDAGSAHAAQALTHHLQNLRPTSGTQIRADVPLADLHPGMDVWVALTHNTRIWVHILTINQDPDRRHAHVVVLEGKKAGQHIWHLGLHRMPHNRGYTVRVPRREA